MNQSSESSNSKDQPLSTGKTEYRSVIADEHLEHATRSLTRHAIQEDLRESVDWTTVCLIDADQQGVCHVVPREQGISAGIELVDWILDELDADLTADCTIQDGERFQPGTPIIKLAGNVRDLLTIERTLLNLISRLCGIATLTQRYVEEISGTNTRLYDTRKTTPGWRLLEKYAVRCGGAHNHRTGLFDGFLIKDNHLALSGLANQPLSVAEATKKAIQWRDTIVNSMQTPNMVEVEVDTLDQLKEVLPQLPNIILLDNFSLEKMTRAVQLRDQLATEVELEASGNVRIDTIRSIANTGVDRISSGALTHQATSLDLGLDWPDGE